MEFKSVIVATLLLVIFVGGSFAAYQIASTGQDAAAQQPKTITNETLVQQVDTWQLVSKSTQEFTAGFKQNVTVYNATGTKLTEGTDYQWNSTDGAISFEDTPSTNDGANANITYTYYENTESVKTISGPLGVITTTLGRSGYIVGALGLVVILLTVGGILAKSFADSGPKSNR